MTRYKDSYYEMRPSPFYEVCYTMLMDITIREYTEGDRAQILQLMKEFNTYFQDIDPWYVLSYNRNSAEMYTQRMIHDTANHDGKLYVAEVDGQIVGFVQGSMHIQTPEEIQERGHVISGDIKELFVTKTYRGKKIGQQLMQVIENYFMAKHCQQLSLDVFAPNMLARDFYQKNGFTERALILVKRLKN